jgi:cyanobactin maturation PatA/PatG family protease
LNLKKAFTVICEGVRAMADENATQPGDPQPEQVNAGASASVPSFSPSPAALADAVRPSDVWPATCTCQGGGATQLVYALGQLGYDFVSEARLDSLVQKMAAHFGTTTSERLMAFDPRQLLAYLEEHPWDAAAIEWTLHVDGSPIYAIRPQGPFAAETYKELRRFLRERLDEGAERISVPGRLAGKVPLLLGQVVPVIVPELRGLYSWTTEVLVHAVIGPGPPEEAPAHVKEEWQGRRAGVQQFLDRVYYEIRNLGITSQERALNYAATNAFQIEKVYESVLKEKERMDLDTIRVTRSPVCRPHSDCWDVELYFFFPDRPVQTVRKVYRFTVDVSDVVPVTVGRIQSWFTR